jgi:hypothetical protein
MFFDLGYSDIYHMTSVFRQNLRDGEMWIEAFEAKHEGEGKVFGREEWDSTLGHCMIRVLISPFRKYFMRSRAWGFGFKLSQDESEIEGTYTSHKEPWAHL